MAERIFPLDSGKAAWSSTLAQAWSVTQTETASGRRRAICSQLYPSYTFNVTFPCLTDAQLDVLMGFYAQCKGGLLPFWFKDYGSGARVEMQKLARGQDGTYQCVVQRGDYVLACEKVDNVRVYIDNTETLDFTVDNGVLTVPSATVASVVTACFDYYQRVRFADTLSVTQTFININKVSLKLATVR